MASIEKNISNKVDVNGYSQVLFRVTIDRNNRFRYKTGIFVPLKQWNVKKSNLNIPEVYANTKNIIIARNLQKECNDLKTRIDNLENKIIRICDIENSDTVTSSFLDSVLPLCADIDSSKLTTALINEKIELSKNPISKSENKTLFELFNEYLNIRKFSYDYTKGMKVLMRILARYEAYQRETSVNKKFSLDINKLTRSDIEDIRDYIRDEYELSKDEPKIFEKLLKEYPAEITVKHLTPKLVVRGENSVIKLIKKFKAFFNWLNENEYTKNKPFTGVKIGSEVVGTPYYLTLAERNKIADFDLSGRPALEMQRDIFIFQCLIGCRVGDLLHMTKDNLVNGAIEYVPHKTKNEKSDAEIIRVPLNKRAKALVNKYKSNDNGKKLFPFVSAQKYNEDIKSIFTICEINRIVTIIDPKTREEIKRPLNEIASSHLARRTFVGNLYKQVKDPNLIGKLSGHSENSRAFARYRNIDEQMKRDLVKLIE